MKYLAIARRAVVLGLVLFLSAPLSAAPIDRIVAVVGNGVILDSELDQAVQRVRSRAGSRAAQMPANVLRSQMLDQMIVQRLQVQRAEERGIEVGDAEIDDGVARIARRNEMNMAQFSRAVSADGMSMGDVRDQIRRELLINKLRRQEVMSQVQVSDQDVDRYLENQALRGNAEREYRLSQILVPVAEDADSATLAEVRQRLETLRGSIVAGDTDFAEAAADRSAADGAERGGDMGWVEALSLPPALAEVASELEPGDISEVFRDRRGYHLLQLEDVRGGSSTTPQRRVMVEEVDARHILLTPNEIRGDQRTRELARQLRERLDAGAEFAALAREYSDDSSTANQGGELGWISPRRLDPTSRRQLASLSPGEVSPIFETAEGYEIIQVEGRRERDQTQQAIRDRARRALGEQRASEEGDLWLRRLRDEAYVDIRMPGYRSGDGS